MTNREKKARKASKTTVADLLKKKGQIPYPLGISMNRYQKYILNKLNRPNTTNNCNVTLSRETIKNALRKLNHGSSEGKNLEPYSLLSVCGFDKNTNPDEDSTVAKDIPWEILPLLDALVTVRKKNTEDGHNKSKTGNELAKLVLGNIIEQIQNMDEEDLLGDYRTRVILQSRYIQKELLQSFEHAVEERASVLHKRLNMISPLKRLEIIDSLCSQLDLALDETVYASDGTPTDISASMVVKQMTKELLFFREEIFRQYRAGMNCQSLPKVRSGNPLKAFESAAQTYNSFLLSLFNTPDKNQDNPMRVKHKTTEAFWERYCITRRYYDSTAVEWGSVREYLMQEMSKEVSNLFAGLRNLRRIDYYVTPSHKSQPHLTGRSGFVQVQYTIQNIRYNLDFALNNLLVFYTVNGLSVGFENRHYYRMQERMSLSYHQIQNLPDFPKEALIKMHEGRTAFEMYCLSATQTMLRDLPDSDQLIKILVEMVFPENSIRSEESLDQMAAKTNLFCRLYACHYAENTVEAIIDGMRKTNQLIHPHSKQNKD